MKTRHTLLGRSKSRAHWSKTVALLSIFAITTAGCTSQGVSADPIEAPSTATNISASMTQATQSTLWLTAKSGPYWSLIALNPTKGTLSDITPTGISSRGGFSVAANGEGVGVVGFYPYVSMIDSPVFITTNQAKSWTTFQLGAGIADVAHPIALSSDRLYALLDTGGRQVIRSQTFSGGSQQTITTPSLRISSIYGESSGIVALTSHNGGYSLYFFNETSRSWNLLAPLPSPTSASLEIDTVDPTTPISANGLAKSPTSSQEVAVCYLEKGRPSTIDEILVSNGVADRTSAPLPESSPKLIGCGSGGGENWFAALQFPHSYSLITHLATANERIQRVSKIPAGSDFAEIANQVFAYHYSGSTLHLLQLGEGVDSGPRIESYLQNLFNKLSGGA